jgi:hypothetical protein
MVIMKANIVALVRGAWAIRRALMLTGQGLTNLAESSLFSICEAEEGAESGARFGTDLDLGLSNGS